MYCCLQSQYFKLFFLVMLFFHPKHGFCAHFSLCIGWKQSIFRRRDKQTITHLCKAGFVACQRQLPIHNTGHDIIPVVVIIIIIIIAGEKVVVCRRNSPYTMFTHYSFPQCTYWLSRVININKRKKNNGSSSCTFFVLLGYIIRKGRSVYYIDKCTLDMI
jgi:hypothetical protein